MAEVKTAAFETPRARSIQSRGKSYGQRAKEQQRDQESAGHDGKRKKGREESEEKRKGPHGRMIRPASKVPGSL